LAVVTGIMRRVDLGKGEDFKKLVLVALNIALFVLVLLIGEIKHRRFLSTNVLFKNAF